MKKVCPKCHRELDTFKDFCVLCGADYNDDPETKAKERLLKAQQEEKQKELEKNEDDQEDKPGIIPAIVYGFVVVLLLPFAFFMQIFFTLFSLDNPGMDTPPIMKGIYIVLLLFLVAFFVVISGNKKNK